MMHLPLSHFLTTILAVLSFTSPTLAATKPKDAILLSEVQSLTLRSGAKTTHRRVGAAPQLKCISNANICKLHEIDLMRCTNQGSGYSSEDIQWSCTANLPPTLKLGSTDVICEGYANSNDEYVLKGSCGVEYRLILSEEGEKQYSHLANGGGSGWGTKSSSKTGEDKLDWSGIIFIFIFVGVLCWMIYGACTSAGANANRNTTRRPRNGGGGGGGGWGPGGGGGGFGGGGWGNDDPPPPYPGSKPSSSSSSQESWRPGFFSGAATGAAAGYFAGQRGNRRTQQRGYGVDNSGSSWFGGGSPSSSSNNNYSSSSSSRQESTGFGGTSRR